MGLQKKTFIFVGAGLLAIMLLLTIIAFQTINEAIDMVRGQRLVVAENIALDIDAIMEHLRVEITDTALVVGQEWEDVPSDSHGEHLKALRHHVEGHLLSFHQIELAAFVLLVNAQGKVLWTEPYLAPEVSRSLAGNAPVRRVVEERQVYIEAGESFLTQGRLTISLIAPVENEEGVVEGVLIVAMPALSDGGGLDNFLERRVIDYDLELVTDSGLVLASSAPGQVIEESPHWELIRGLSQKRLSGVVNHSGRGEMENHMVAFAPLAQVPWGVVLEQPEDEALRLPWVLGRRFLIISGAAVLVAVGLIFGFTQQIVSPLRRLAATAQRFGAGDLEAVIPPMNRDEIGKLAESLDTMRHQLKHSLDQIRGWNQELEQRVKQRTNELEELYQQLHLRNKERGDLLGKIITAQEEERRRMARELHDDVSQTLTGLVMSLGSIEALLVQYPTVRQKVESLRRLASDAVEEVRRLIRDLRPSLLDDLGLVAAIGWYVENYLAPAGVEAKLETQGLARRLPPNVEITLFRIVQEAVTNIVKHAHAKTSRIRLQLTPSAIVGSIEDDGTGFAVDTLYRERAKGRAVGLLGMEERIKLLGGKLSIESRAGQGTKVRFEIPWQVNSGEKNSRSDS